jgi:hypothetical protein
VADRTWEIRAEHNLGELTVMRFNGFAADSEGPTIYDREQFEEFVSNLRHAAATLWPDAPMLPHPEAPQGIAVKGPDTGMCGNADALRAKGNEVRDLDGGLLARHDYPELYQILGDTFGSTDAETFRLPDLRGRVVDP